MADPSTDRRALTALAAAAGDLARRSELDETLQAILTITTEALGAEVAGVFVSDPDRAADGGGPVLQLAAAVGVADDALAAFEVAVADDPGHPTARAAWQVTTSIGRQGTTPDGAAATGADLPLVIARDGVEQAIGAVSFAWRGAHPIDEAETSLLAGTADLLAAAIDRARVASLVQERAEWYERLAHVDPLTGLANARTLGRVLELEVARAVRQGGEVSVVLFDVDDFSVVNAVEGRRRGDDVLRIVAGILGGSVRMVDTVARTGADEFVVVAPGSAGRVVGQRIIDAVAAALDGSDRAVSVSAGVARFPADGTNGEELLAAARAALDDARTKGRGQLGGVGAA